METNGQIDFNETEAIKDALLSDGESQVLDTEAQYPNTIRELTEKIASMPTIVRSYLLAGLLAVSLNISNFDKTYAETSNPSILTEENIKSQAEVMDLSYIDNYFLGVSESGEGFDLVKASEVSNLTLEDQIVLNSSANVLPAIFRGKNFNNSQNGSMDIIRSEQIGPHAYRHTALAPAHGFHYMYPDFGGSFNGLAPLINIGIQGGNYWPASIDFGPNYEVVGLDTNESDTARVTFITNVAINPTVKKPVQVSRSELSNNPGILNGAIIYVAGFPIKIDAEDFDNSESVKRVIIKGSVHSLVMGEDGNIATIKLSFPPELSKVIKDMEGISGGRVSFVHEGVEYDIGTYRGFETYIETGKLAWSVVTPNEDTYAKSGMRNPAVPEANGVEVSDSVTISDLAFFLLENSQYNQFKETLSLIYRVHNDNPIDIIIENGFVRYTVNRNGEIISYEIDPYKMVVAEYTLG